MNISYKLLASTHIEQTLTSKGLQSLVLEDTKIVFFSALQGTIIMVIRTDSKTKDKKINKLGVDVIKILEELYSADDIKNWNGDVVFFSKFMFLCLHLLLQFFRIVPLFHFRQLLGENE